MRTKRRNEQRRIGSVNNRGLLLMCCLILLSCLAATAEEIPELPFPVQTKFEEFGNFSGKLGFHYHDMSNREDNRSREEFGNAFTFLKFESVQKEGFRFGIAGLFQEKFADNEDSYTNNIDKRSSILAELYLDYTYSKTTVTLGRKELRWMMLNNYFEGVFIESDDIDGFNIRLAWANRSARLDTDLVTAWNEFASTTQTDTDGIYGGEITYNGIDNLEVTGIYYRSNGAFMNAGGRAIYNHAMESFTNRFTAEYYVTDENDNHGLRTEGKGSILHFDYTAVFDSFSIGGGYVEADRKTGGGSLLNNVWDPFGRDGNTHRINGETFYVKATYKPCERIDFMVVYGDTHTDEGTDEDAHFRELLFVTNVKIYKNLDFQVGISSLDTTDDIEQGRDKIFVNCIYSF